MPNQSNVAKLTEARSGIELMPELEAKPVNRYLPPTVKSDTHVDDVPDLLTPMINKVPKDLKGFLGWVDRTLDKI